MFLIFECASELNKEYAYKNILVKIVTYFFASDAHNSRSFESFVCELSSVYIQSIVSVLRKYTFCCSLFLFPPIFSLSADTVTGDCTNDTTNANAKNWRFSAVGTDFCLFVNGKICTCAGFAVVVVACFAALSLVIYLYFFPKISPLFRLQRPAAHEDAQSGQWMRTRRPWP